MVSRLLSFLICVLSGSAAAFAQVEYSPVMGDIETTTFSVSCPSNPSGCSSCINDVDAPGDNRLILAFGQTWPNSQATGIAEGVVRPFVVIDGVRLTPELFPCESVIRVGVNWSDLPLAGSCGGQPKGVTYEVGSLGEVSASGDGSAFVDIPATEAAEIPFRFTLCSQFLYIGSGCEIGGSANNRWRLRMPAPLHAIQVPAGDASLAVVPSSECAIDFVSSAGGAVSVSRVLDDVPGAPPVMHVNGYWDIHSDLEPGAFLAEIVFTVNPATLPPGVDPAGVAVARFDPAAMTWEPMLTVTDTEAGTATVTTDRFSKFVLIESAAVPVEPTSWGRVKSRYR